MMNLDYTLISASNCTECPSRKYDDGYSEMLGTLNPVTNTTESIELSLTNTKYSFVVNGSFVKDAFSTEDVSSQADIYESKERYEFFLIHNMTIGSA